MYQTKSLSKKGRLKMSDSDPMQTYNQAVAEYEREAPHAEHLGDVLIAAARDVVAQALEHEAATKVKRRAYMKAIRLARNLKAQGEDVEEPTYSRFRAADIGPGVGCVEIRLVDESFTGTVAVDSPPASLELQLAQRATYQGTAADVFTRFGGLLGLAEGVARSSGAPGSVGQRQ